ncbi:MAG: hypothetical protein IMW98_09985 [Firmicutes bacterium]|nr:hypothetical protein [Bacillota bacterium]
MDQETKQFTVRLPKATWERLVAVAREQRATYNDTVVDLISSALERREREAVLARLARHRGEIARKGGRAWDSTEYIRALREGRVAHSGGGKVGEPS